MNRENIHRELKDFLEHPDNIALLEDASKSGKTAVEGIRERFLERFPEHVFTDNFKQTLGHRVLRIMENRGWVIDKKSGFVFEALLEGHALSLA